MKIFILLLVYSCTMQVARSQNTGVGTPTPVEKLDVNGAIKIGNTAGNNEGTIRYNNGNFEGRTTNLWQNLAVPLNAMVLSESSNDANLLANGFSLKGPLNVTENTLINATAAAGSWHPVSEYYSRVNTVSVTANSRIAIWGGVKDGVYLNTGAFYDPVNDLWESISTVGAPSPRIGHALVWNGTELVVWGGFTYNGSYAYLGDGAKYNSITKTWTPLNSAGAPSARGNVTSGYNSGTNEMIVWGGFNGPTLNEGYRYNFTTDTWTPVSLVNSPGIRINYAHATANGYFLVWGGYSFASSGQVNTGALYNFSTDTWTPTSLVSAPAARENADAVWNGTQMIVWGGTAGAVNQSGGARLNPVTNTWATMVAGPIADNGATIAYAGSFMLIYGIGGGALYNNTANTWSSLMGNYPAAGRNGAVVQSANNVLVVWGGEQYGAVGDFPQYYNDGRRYFWFARSITSTVPDIKTYYLYKKIM